MSVREYSNEAVICIHLAKNKRRLHQSQYVIDCCSLHGTYPKMNLLLVGQWGECLRPLPVSKKQPLTTLQGGPL